MAHKGVAYELAFRRDLCLGCTNYANAFPLAFKCTYSMVVPLPTNRTFTGTAVKAEMISDPADEDMQWETADTTQHGLTYRIRIEFDGFTFSNGTTKVRWLFIAGGVAVGELRMIQEFPGRCFSFIGNLSGGLNVLWLDASFWGNAAGTATESLTPWRWTDS